MVECCPLELEADLAQVAIGPGRGSITAEPVTPGLLAGFVDEPESNTRFQFADGSSSFKRTLVVDLLKPKSIRPRSRFR